MAERWSEKEFAPLFSGLIAESVEFNVTINIERKDETNSGTPTRQSKGFCMAVLAATSMAKVRGAPEKLVFVSRDTLSQVQVLLFYALEKGGCKPASGLLKLLATQVSNLVLRKVALEDAFKEVIKNGTLHVAMTLKESPADKPKGDGSKRARAGVSALIELSLLSIF
jgi:hypothetical protein